jgi:ligand-binding sensor domain-containing protein
MEHEGRSWFGVDYAPGNLMASGVCSFDGQAWKADSSERAYWICAERGSAEYHASQGILWFATHRGVLRFDGQEWKKYSLEGSIPTHHVRSVAVDPVGRKWFGAGQGLCTFDGKKWESIFNGMPSRRSQFIGTLAIDSQGMIWVSSGSTIASYDGKIWTETENPQKRLGGVGGLSPIILTPAGKVWALISGHACRLEDGKWVEVSAPGGNPASMASRLCPIAPEGDGRMWFVTDKPILYCLQGESWTSFPFPNEAKSLLARTIAVDSKGKKWIGTSSANLTMCGTLLSFDGAKWQMYAPPKSASATPAPVYTGPPAPLMFRERPAAAPPMVMLADHDDRIWLGTDGMGLWCFDGETWKSWTSADFLAGNQVSSLAVDLDGTIWAVSGAYSSGVSHIVLQPKD